MPITNNVKQVKLKVMTEAQFEETTPNENEFYAVTDAQLSYNDLADKPTIGDATLTIQKNGTAVDTFTANATSDKTINITVPTQPSDIGAATSAQGALADSALQPSDVVNNTTSTATDAPLSANMGKSLQDQVNNLNGRGRYLALWNCATGLAQSNPPQTTYTYKAGDYFIVGTVATGSGTNYRPSGSSYTTGVASTVVETEDVAVNDVYYYDGTTWSLQINTQKEVAFVNVAGDPYDNTNLANALNNKVTGNNAITGATKCKITYDSKGLVTAGADLSSGDIPDLSSTYATAAQGALADTAVQPADLNGYVPYSGATGAVDLNNKNLKNISNLAVGTATVDSNEKILSVGQNRFVTNNQNGLFISSTTSQTRKGMYGVPMALEIQFNSNNQAYSYPLGFHDMNSNNNGGQFLFTSFSSAISAASAGDVMVENDKGGLIFNTGASKSGAKMRFTVGNWASTPQITITANSVGIKNLNPNSNYALDVTGTINASTDVKVNGVSVALPSQTGQSGKFLTTDGTTTSWAEVQGGGGDANVKVEDGGSSEPVDLEYLYIDSYGADYSFSYDYNSGTIKNNNSLVDSSYAYGVVELYTEDATTATVYFHQSSEQNYDFGEISELGYYLNMDNDEDLQGVLWSGKDYDEYEGSVEFELEAGYNYFTIKYIKDSSSESGDDLFEITGITLGSGSGSARLINTDTQEEIQVSQLGDLPQVLQEIRGEIPDTNNLVTLNTTQTIQAAKAIFGTDVAFGSDASQKNLLAVISNNNSTAGTWVGRLTVGAKNKTFIMGTYGTICVLGAHSWTNAQQGTGAAWEPVYINPDGDKAVYIGGSPINGKQALMVLQNVNANTTGTVKINRSSNLTNNFKDVACWSDNVSKFTNDAGYITSNALSGYQTTANLVTSVSSRSTDSQYPSAKLFYDTCGDIETLINAL